MTSSIFQSSERVADQRISVLSQWLVHVMGAVFHFATWCLKPHYGGVVCSTNKNKSLSLARLRIFKATNLYHHAPYHAAIEVARFKSLIMAQCNNHSSIVGYFTFLHASNCFVYVELNDLQIPTILLVGAFPLPPRFFTKSEIYIVYYQTTKCFYLENVHDLSFS